MGMFAARSALRRSAVNGVARRAFAVDSAPVLKLNLTTPHQTILQQKEASLVTVPGSAGYFGIAADHVPTVSEVKPGLVSIDETEHYFVSGGFVFVHEDSAVDLSVLEAFPLDHRPGSRQGWHRHVHKAARRRSQRHRSRQGSDRS